MIDLRIADPTVEAYVLLLNASDIVSRYAERQLSRIGVTSTQYAVLMNLSTGEEPPTLTELGQRLYRSKNGLTTVIDNMEKEGLVQRVRDRVDRRAIRVMATEKGSTLLESVRGPSKELVRYIMSCYDEEEIRHLSGLLRRVRTHVLQAIPKESMSDPGLDAS